MRELLNRLRSFLLRSRRDVDFDEEIDAHLTLAIDEYQQRGLSSEEARRQALLRFGGRVAAKELHRDFRSLPVLEWMLQDFRYAGRTMRRERGFTLFVVLISALGIGASVTVFSVLNTLLVRPLPFVQPERLVWIANQAKDGDLSGATLQVNPFLSYRRSNQSFTDLAAYFAFYTAGDVQLKSAGHTERLNALPVSQNFFSLLGVQPQLGRYFSNEECKWNGPRAVLLSYGLWTQRFGSDPRIVGRKIILDDAPVTVVGVMPASFDFGAVFAPGTQMDLYVPFALSPETDRWGNTLSIIGRLKPGVSVSSAAAEAKIRSAQITKELPRANGLNLEVSTLKHHVSGRVRPALLLLGLAVGVVLLIVCANISNLLLARGLSRQKELAVRSALGAGRGRLAAQILTETLSLSFLGALLGTLLAYGGTRALAHLTAYHVPLLSEVSLNGTAVGFSLLLAVLTGVIFGLIPALQVPSIIVNNALKAKARGATDSRKHSWLRGSLVVAEVAFACLLLVTTGLLLRSFLRVLDVDLGFRPSRTVALRIDRSTPFRSREEAKQYIREALRRVRDIPGVEAAALTDALPLGRNRTWGAGAVGQIYKAEEYPLAFVHVVTEGYWQALGVDLKAGRTFTETDDAKSKQVVVINESLAQRLWPGQNPLGKRLRGAGNGSQEVIGVVRDVRHIALEQSSGNEMYFSMRQIDDFAALELVVRSRLKTADLAGPLRTALLTLDPDLPREPLIPLQSIVDQSVSPRRFFVFFLAGFSFFALVLASLGIYAVISYSVGQRKSEFGIRMALGASPAHLRGSVLRQTLGLAAIGLGIGGALSGMLTQELRELLFGITPGDPVTFAAMLLILLAVAIIAGYLPARRASLVNPTVALRAD